MDLTTEEKILAEEALRRYIDQWTLEKNYLTGKQNMCVEEDYDELEKYITFCENRISIAESALEKFAE